VTLRAIQKNRIRLWMMMKFHEPIVAAT